MCRTSKTEALINSSVPNSKGKIISDDEPLQKICVFCSFTNRLEVPALCDTKCKRKRREYRQLVKQGRHPRKNRKRSLSFLSLPRQEFLYNQL